MAALSEQRLATYAVVFFPAVATAFVRELYIVQHDDVTCSCDVPLLVCLTRCLSVPILVSTEAVEN